LQKDEDNNSSDAEYSAPKHLSTAAGENKKIAYISDG
jgi:hypothetical protein